MKKSHIFLVLLTAVVGEAIAKEALYTAGITAIGSEPILVPQNNYNGWINPEDLTPMPQCIAQQDQSTWLSTMTRCTSKRCTSHFGIICTHHQWLTQLSCLSTEFSPDVIKGYLPYCSRSILAKAQLYLWIRNVTGRTWLVDVGDANGLQYLSPASLTEGYAAVKVTYNAPICLTGSVSAPSMEPFQHVLASCSFTSTTKHTGNAARPWEYSESIRSMIALDFETVGYDLVRYSIRDGDYFDKECFCGAFTIDWINEPCSRPGRIDLTRERLWMNATCGPTSVPDNWTDMIKTIEFAYIPMEDWHWPTCVADIPKQVIELPDQCVTEACEVDSSGYCKEVKRVVDRACFCRDVRYGSCGGSCQIFETRIDYVKWLHDLCGNVQDWHGLPDNWRQLAAPTPLDMIPWRWTLKPSNHSNTASIHFESINTTGTCASNERKLGSIVLVNIATLFAAFLSRRTSIHRIARDLLWHPRGWFFKGTIIAALQLLANWFNVFLVQNTPGYEDVPSIELMLFWCSIPRLAWVTILFIGLQPFKAINLTAVASSLFAETILQLLLSYYMIMTVNYGVEHNFYIGGMENARRERPAKAMYAGALLWLIVISVALALSISVHYWIDKSRASKQTQLTSREGGDYTVYGTLPVKSQINQVSREAYTKLYAVTAISLFLLWIAQWLFWGGFIGLSSEEFCPPKLGVLTIVWMAFSLAGAIVGAN